MFFSLIFGTKIIILSFKCFCTLLHSAFLCVILRKVNKVDIIYISMYLLRINCDSEKNILGFIAYLIFYGKFYSKPYQLRETNIVKSKSLLFNELSRGNAMNYILSSKDNFCPKGLH